MATQIPLVLIGGRVKQLPLADTLDPEVIPAATPSDPGHMTAAQATALAALNPGTIRHFAAAHG